MCAINGFNFRDKDLICKMNQVTSHRGPDSSGVFLDDDISLGHNRLSIIDLSDLAGQPMKSADGKHTIVFNGEIYNFNELKKELKGYPFKTKSDTEMILAAYRKWGHDCVKRFNGIFAFAIWDKTKNELFLARDHVGVKPLYYFLRGGRFIFSSEIKAILEHGMTRTLNREAFNHYLRILYVPEPLTMFEGIYKLPPASYGVFSAKGGSSFGGKNGEFKIKKYWDVVSGSHFERSSSEIKKELKEKISESVKNQLVSDRPLGIYLSGGIDSSIILYNASQFRKNTDTFSVGFELSKDEEKEKFNADFELARKTAKHFGANHNEILVSQKDVVELFEKAVWHMDEPVSNPTIISMMKLSKFTKGKADVVLGGDGGDELFGGYQRYRYSLMSSYYRKLPYSLRKILSSTRFSKLDTPSGIERFARFMFQKTPILSRIISDDFLDLEISKNFFKEKYFSDKLDISFEEIFMNTDRQSWLVDESLMRTDKMAMSSGLEARVPLLDKDLVEFSAHIPLKYKVSLFDKKIILKDAFRKDLPSFLFDQPKRGWFSPGAKWLRQDKVYSMAQDILSKDYCNSTADLFNWSEVKKMFEDHYNKEEYNFVMLWAILTFQVWAKLYKIQL